jgi:hypothetical protein
VAETCYPYIRFSTSKQEGGDSIARQTQRINEFVASRKLLVNPTLEDYGVSGFRGKNQKKGALSEFLAKVRAGEIKKNSILLIENWDRLSRQVLDASIELFSELIRSGIRIAVLDEGTVYDDLTSISYIRAIVQFERAHSESKRKSDMSVASWGRKHEAMETGKIATNKCPHWLTVVDGKFVVDEAKRLQINDLFELSLSHGMAEATRHMNKKHGVDWKIYQSQYLLKNRRLLGEHTPVKVNSLTGKNEPTDKVLPSYYPQIVSYALFDEVNKVLNSRQPFAGRQDRTNSNILRSLVFCAHCGGTVRYMKRGEKESYLCTKSLTGGCDVPGIRSIRAEGVKKALFRQEEHTKISAFLANSEHQVITLKDELAEANEKLSQCEKKIAKLQAQHAASEDDDEQSVLLSLLTTQQKQKTAFTKQIGEISESLKDHENLVSFNISAKAERFMDLLDDETEEAMAQRAKLNRYLRSIFDRVEINFLTQRLESFPRSVYLRSDENPTGIPSVSTFIEIPADKRFKKVQKEIQPVTVGKGKSTFTDLPDSLIHKYTGKDFLK